jgi:hypothetical protein
MLCLQYILICQYAIYVLIRENVRKNQRNNKEWKFIDTTNIEHKIQNEENKKTQNITQKTTNISNMDPTKAPGLWCYSQSCKSIVGDRVKKEST